MPTIERTRHDIYPFISPTSGLVDAANGKTVLITGGSRGIGRAIARHFALAGALTVYIVGRNKLSLVEACVHIKDAGPTCEVVYRELDVLDEAAVGKFFAEMGRVPDVLVNNAGVCANQDSIVGCSVENWWRDWEVNVKGVFVCTRAYLRALQGREGVILNVSSSVSDVVTEGMSSYGSSKMAVNRLTECVHAEHAKEGIRCIAFHPGGIKETGLGATVPEQFRNNLHDTVDLAGGTAVFLSTPRAAFLAGRFVYANWDMQEVERLKDDIIKGNLLVSKMRLGDQFSGKTLPPM